MVINKHLNIAFIEYKSIFDYDKSLKLKNNP